MEDSQHSGDAALDGARIDGALAFLREAERLKSVLRTAWTRDGRQESTADHTWRLCLMAMVFERELGDVDLLHVLKLALIHDLGEAIGGDVPAPLAGTAPDKLERERTDFHTLTRALPTDVRDELRALWEEYSAAETPAARLVKGLDKLETIVQHNQGENPPWLDYDFNLAYGARYTRDHELLVALRERVDEDTRRNAARRRDLFAERTGDELQQASDAARSALAGGAELDRTGSTNR